ncbi:hypothetical protein OFC21_33110, partial [Escherichia coli]|nr:hypothetical protein [Escherichia coli]
LNGLLPAYRKFIKSHNFTCCLILLQKCAAGIEKIGRPFQPPNQWRKTDPKPVPAFVLARRLAFGCGVELFRRLDFYSLRFGLF